MNKAAGNFMKAAVIYGLAGAALGLYMGAATDFAFRSVHAHLNLIGWATMAICAAYYQLVPAAGRMKLSSAHFWVANAGMIVLTASLAMIAKGSASAGPFAGIGSVMSLIGFIIFAVVVFRSACEQR